MGSVETTIAEKRKLARESLEFNLKDRMFCELFPALAAEVRRSKGDVF